MEDLLLGVRLRVGRRLARRQQGDDAVGGGGVFHAETDRQVFLHAEQREGDVAAAGVDVDDVDHAQALFLA